MYFRCALSCEYSNKFFEAQKYFNLSNNYLKKCVPLLPAESEEFKEITALITEVDEKVKISIF